MVQPKKSAHEITGNKMNQQRINELKTIEDALNGSNKDLINIPDKLSEDAQAYYVHLISVLNLNILSNIDKPLLEQASSILAQIDECHEGLKKGLVIETFDSKGNKVMKENPYTKVLKEREAAYLNISKLLGLNPSTRLDFSREISTENIKENVNVSEFDQTEAENIANAKAWKERMEQKKLNESSD